jgi:electron transfer flavoprotein beta subunit
MGAIHQVIVCVKQVPEVTEVKIHPETKALIREGVPSIVNPFDEFAVEEAIRIRERHGGTVVAISMGPPQAEQALNTCLAMGVDEAILLSDKLLIGADTIATSYALSKVIEQLGEFEIILCGQQAIDGDTGQVGPGIAENLGIAQVTYVSRVIIDEPGGKATLQREIEEGYELIECKFPVLLSVTKGINEPRFPSKEKPTKHVRSLCATDLSCDLNRLGMEGSYTQVIDIFPPKPRKREGFTIDSRLSAAERIGLILSGGVKEKTGEIMEGKPPDQIAEKVTDYLSDRGLIHPEFKA